MGNCKDCIYWNFIEEECYVDWISESESIGNDSMGIYADADDDSNLRCGLKTGPMFGCIRFERATWILLKI